MTDEKPDFCQNFKALAVSPVIDQKRPFTRLRCKMWTCPYCAAKNREIWRATLIHHIHEARGDWSWWTLTAHSKKRGAIASLKNLRDAWDTLVKRMKRRFGEFSYARIFEKHKDGSYHLHVISSFHFGDTRVRTDSKTGEETSYSRWLAAQAKELKIGYYTHAEDIQNEQFHSGFIASYITKYIVKLDTITKTELGRVRHVQVSQNWIRRKMDVQGTWNFKFGVYYTDVENAGNDYRYYDLKLDKYVNYEDFDDTYIYPPEFSDITK